MSMELLWCASKHKPSQNLHTGSKGSRGSCRSRGAHTWYTSMPPTMRLVVPT